MQINKKKKEKMRSKMKEKKDLEISMSPKSKINLKITSVTLMKVKKKTLPKISFLRRNLRMMISETLTKDLATLMNRKKMKTK